MLQDFLGESSEIRIFDFLAQNTDNSYNQSEISEFTGLSRTTVYKKIRELVASDILEVDQEVGNIKSYQLAQNKTVDLMIAAIIAHSMAKGETHLTEEQVKDKVARNTDASVVVTQNRYYLPSKSEYTQYIIPPECGYFRLIDENGNVTKEIQVEPDRLPVIKAAA